MEHSDKVIYQPLHPSIRGKLDPEYVAFHDGVLQYVEPAESRPWDPSSRDMPSPLFTGVQKPVRVGKTFDKAVENIQLRVFVPEGHSPLSGWPCLVWLHGGGWVYGGLASDRGFLSHVCKYVNCVVISMNYRHAPEHVYPAAIEDVFIGLKWIMQPEVAKPLHIDPACYALGGLSAGGCLAAILALKAALDAELLSKPRFQLLVCPVIDNTATISSTWKTAQHSPWLTPRRMAWYRQMYLPEEHDRRNWDVSPCFAPKDLLAKSPKTFVAIADCDLLAAEGLAFSDLLKDAGVNVEVQTYAGATHSVLVLAGIHQTGQNLVHGICQRLAEEFQTRYDRLCAKILPE